MSTQYVADVAFFAVILIVSVSVINVAPSVNDDVIFILSSATALYTYVTVIPAFVYVPLAFAGLVETSYPSMSAALVVYAEPTFPVIVVAVFISLPDSSTYLTVTVPFSTTGSYLAHVPSL